ncbi:MAG: toprim domain-containing protein [Acutalibacteraceae bacterium]
MIKLEQPVIVEGKYDKITLENIIDALIIPTDGFSIFKNKEKCELIRTLARRSGVIVITDSDSAGNMIRSYIKKIVGDSPITNVYIPQLKGKEKRKATYSKQGFLGLEGMSREIIEECLKRSGITGKPVADRTKKITKTDMFLAGLSGSENSAERRAELLKRLSLPQGLSPNAMLDILNTIMTYDEFCEVSGLCQKKDTKS